MIVGRVTNTPEAIVTVQLRGPGGVEAPVEAVIDTGFTDFLTLPRRTINNLHLIAMDTLECQLADGRTVALESFLVVVLWDGSPREILALAADGEPLLGMSLLYGSRVVMTVLAGGELTIEQAQ